MKTKSPFTTILLTTVIVLFLSAATPQDAFAGHGWRTLVGSWDVAVTPDGPPPFRNLTTINWPGTIINTDPVFGGGHGAWKRIGKRTFKVRFLHQVTPEAAETLPFPAIITSVTVTGTITVGDSGDTASGPFFTIFFDAAGNKFPLTGTVEFTRIKVD